MKIGKENREKKWNFFPDSKKKFKKFAIKKTHSESPHLAVLSNFTQKKKNPINEVDSILRQKKKEKSSSKKQLNFEWGKNPRKKNFERKKMYLIYLMNISLDEREPKKKKKNNNINNYSD